MDLYDNSHLLELQQSLKKERLKAYMIVSSDPHNSEEPAPCFSFERLWYCPFVGTNATVIVTPEKAFLFVDGRFFISAEKDIAGTPYTLMKMGEPGVPEIEDFLLQEGLYPLAIDFSNISPEGLKALQKGGKVVDFSFASTLKERPIFPSSPLWRFDDPKYQDFTAEEKIAKVREEMAKKGAEAHLITALDDIAYLTNLRGNDIENTPLFLSYLYLGKDGKNYLFLGEGRYPGDYPGFEVLGYQEISSFLKAKGRNKAPTLVDPNTCNAKLYSLFEKPIDGEAPSRLLKAIKTKKEIENIISIQEEDGAALLKFLLFVEKNKEKKLSEWDYSLKLGEYRKQGKRYIEDSFPTIAAVGSNAAMMHYGPSAETSSIVDPDKDIELLVDSGGQYFGGTTDTTRTILIGKPTEEYIHDYTLTLKSVIALTTTIFIDGASGRSLDLASREIMWKEGLDYKCGTGHGVGYLSVVHEGPNGFRYKPARNKGEDAKMVPGMVTTVEPGVYKANKYGIRIENNLLCVPHCTTPDGIFYKFETVTYVPIDLRAVDLTQLSEQEKQWVNAYHEETRKRLLPYLNKEEAEFLKEVTKAI